LGSWKITTNKDSLNVIVEGVMTPQNAKDYYDEFLNASKKINPATCDLFLDGSKLAVSKADSAKILGAILQMYKDLGFNKVTMDLGSNAILNMQVKMLAKQAGLTDFKLA
jgi:hypothetical protein